MLKKEWKNLFKNKFLIVALIAIITIPTIYTTLFLGSMWDPYGKVDNLPVAVVNEDKPVTYEGKDVNVGEKFVDKLKDNDSLAFNFVDKETATNGLENGMFQMGKILVQRLVSTFGTAAIAAHAVAFSLTSIAVVPGMALGLAILTVVGQCIRANDYQQAKYYTEKLMIIAYISTIISAGILLVGVRYILRFYALPQDTANLAVSMVSLHCIFDFFVWPMAFSFPNALRAANDATFTMIVSTFSMWTFRFALSYVFALYLHMGVIGVWWAMIVDWIFRSICFMIRYRSNKWMNRTLV